MKKAFRLFARPTPNDPSTDTITFDKLKRLALELGPLPNLIIGSMNATVILTPPIPHFSILWLVMT